MPFMKGRAPVRRTLEYLSAGKLVLKERVKIFSVNYNTFGDHHDGARYLIHNIINSSKLFVLFIFCLFAAILFSGSCPKCSTKIPASK